DSMKTMSIMTTDSIKIFHELRLSVMIFDYRGYGRSEGVPSERGTYLDAEAAWTYLARDRGVRPETVVVFGRSLGGAVAAHLALDHSAAALIVESAFTSVPDLGADLFPYLPVRLICRFRYPTAEFVKRIPIPKLFIHSPDDEVIPYRYGERLLAIGAEPKEFLRISGGHNEGFLESGRLYREGLDSFIGRVLGTK
ncbi:MAG: alpha/beta hydrolase, partial [Thermodesulfovibrionales bacterium]